MLNQPPNLIGTFRLTWAASEADPRPNFVRNPIPAIPVTLLNGIWTLEPFSIAIPAWIGASYIVGQTSFTFDFDFFTIQVPIEAPSDTFLACVKWLDGDGVTVYRYKLWDNDTSMLIAPNYQGETIPNNAKLEIWSVQLSLIAAIPVAWNLLIGNLFIPDGANTSGSKNILGSNQS